MGVEFGILGEVSAWADGRPINLGPARQRCVLAALLVDANHPVSLDQLTDRVWGDAPPQRAAGTLHSYLSRLRSVLSPSALSPSALSPSALSPSALSPSALSPSALSPSALSPSGGIHRSAAGYLLRVREEAVDLHRFRALLARARASDDLEAARLYEVALGLWRGEPFAGLDTPWLAALRHTLQTEHLSAWLDHHDVQLRLGRHAELLPELAVLADRHPLDERLVGQLILALYRNGRQAEALDRYERTRRRLADELGADPGPGLRRLHLRMLSAETTLAPRPVPVPRQLPQPPPSFAGRSRELAALDRIMAAPGDTVVISAIGGTGGVGKTWLALHWAHANLPRFPDGQLYVNLRGFDPSDAPMPPETAVRGFLDALGVDAAAVPVGLEAQAALYRSLVAGKRMLIVLDNARDTDQVTPLLPGSPSCAVLVTSRRLLPGLITGHGARPIPLDAFDPEEARQAITGLLGEERVRAEPDAVADLLDRCGGLPLALGIVAARARMHPGFPLAVLAGQLREDSSRLDLLDAGEQTASLRAVFSWSYRALTPPAARLFRLLGSAFGTDLGGAAAASLAGLTGGEVRVLLGELVRAHLVTENVAGRFTMHDLLRAYAAEQHLPTTTAVHADSAALDGPSTPAVHTDSGALDGPGFLSDQRRAATCRLLDHYLHTAHAAALIINRSRQPLTLDEPQPGTSPAHLADHDQAMEWFATEHPTLLAAVRHAADAGLGTRAWQLGWTLSDYLDRQGRWLDLLAAHSAALDVTRRQADRFGEAQSHAGASRALIRLGRLDDARADLERAIALFTELGDRDGRTRAHLGLGFIHQKQDRPRAALEEFHQALTLHREAGNEAGAALFLNSIGYQLVLLGEYEEAIPYCQEALDLHAKLGYRHGQASAGDSLAYAYHHLGRFAEAAELYRRSIGLFQEVGDRWHEADTTVHLGEMYDAAGDRAAALDTFRRALELLEQLNHPDADRLRARLAG
ncbi:BTAD domain-containing putative transcriptional regulator [Nonomuraea angiospora]|uniref:DNA-binding SARP family transcriptional activator/Tfp pilus assembly protein PilF n=1 Tax=Nonomuraea angiospora TaxID=46172 RepID=A0ABR9MG40_9ACTN|nr:BTAD domain-containing putative transcriptional regulator [Nonomuraea angiospora]MBE1591877.1 DNA-binding SARP family transcriptional activator/Tfp pilus assembly protein PilF [Nonomuraea angiospora]